MTKFVPTVLKVKRGAAAIGKGPDKMLGFSAAAASRFEDPLSMKGRMGGPGSMNNQHMMMMTGPSTDDAYDTFMKEINQLV